MDPTRAFLCNRSKQFWGDTTMAKTAARKICIIGASAGVGLECVHEALSRGHQVVTLSRSIDALPTNSALTPLQGNALNTQDVRRAIDGAEVILICLGLGSSRKPTTLFSDFARVLKEVEREIGDMIVINLSGFGAAESLHYYGWFRGLLFRLFIGKLYVDKSVLDTTLQRSRLNWIIVRPGLLTNQVPVAPARVMKEYQEGMAVRSISRRAVARFMIDQVEMPTFVHTAPALSGK